MKNTALLVFILSFLLVSCGDDSGNSADDSETITNKTVSGVVQFGPFEKGATVAVYELDEKFQKTGINYKTEIENDQGEFSIKLKDLKSKYALLKADGYYRSPVTGEKANKKATLYALADLENDSEININILTHLSHKRAIYLSTEKDKSIAKAKKKAEAEVLKSFGIEEDFDEAKNLNIIGNDNQSIALLAMSIMMQSGVDETKLKERLTNYATDIEEDGVWNDEETIAQIADWTYKVYYHSAFGAIKENVKKWNSSAVFATFEKYTNAFWHSHYGLGTCTDDRKNEVRRNELFFSDFEKKYFICRPGGKWKEASDQLVEKFFNIDENATDGMVRNIKHESDSNTTKCEVYEDGEWRIGNDNDCNYGIGGCTKKREGLSKISLDYQYTCKNQEWIRTYISTDIEYNDSAFIQPIRFDLDVIGWKDTTDGTIRKGNFSDVVYIFDKDVWRVANLPEASLGKCTKENQDSAGYAEYRDGQTNLNPLYSICNYNNQLYNRYDNCPNSHYQSGYYKCIYTITEGTNDTLFAWSSVKRCSLDKYDFKDGKITPWKNGKEGETRWGNPLEYQEKLKNTYSAPDYICQQKCYKFTNGEWTQASITQCMGLGTCDDSNKGTTKKGPIVYYKKICVSEYDMIDDKCYNILVVVDSLRKTNYVCQGNKIYEHEITGYNTFLDDYDPTPVTGNWFSQQNYIYNPPSSSSQHTCQMDGSLVPGEEDPQKLYICDVYGFRLATETEINTYQLDCPTDGSLVPGKKNPNMLYVCNDDWWKIASATDIAMNLHCEPNTYGEYRMFKGTKAYFVCDTISDGDEPYYFWNYAIEKNIGSMTDPRDSTIYKTTIIGTNTWMAENLNYADSTNYPSMLKRNECEGNQLESCKKYGRLYTWSAAIDSIYWSSKGKKCGYMSENEEACGLPDTVQGICPKGWHVPTTKEWDYFYDWVVKNVWSPNLNDMSNPSVKTLELCGFLPLVQPEEEFYKEFIFWSSNDLNGLESYGMKSSYNLQPRDGIRYAQNYSKTKPKNDKLQVRCVKDD